jgi:subtilisin family serine protease
MAAERSRIAQMRNNVLSQLAFHEYEERQSYRAVPALAGRIKSEAALLALAHNPHVIKIDLEQGFSGHLANSIPVIAADLRHAEGNTGNGVVVAVIDSGLDTDHDNLADDLITEVCFADDDGTIDGAGRCPNGSDRQFGPGAAEDDAGHGTHVTGIVTSNGTLGSVGAAPDAGIIAIKVTWGPTFAGEAAFFSEIVAAFDYIINNPELGVQVINMSVGAGAYEGDCDTDGASNIAMAAAINTLRANGVTTFASAGNDYSSLNMSTPACLSNVISVGASDNSDVAADFTNSNASTDIFAPGVDVLSSAMGNGTTTASGTSMSSPHAAGCAALLIEAGDATTPDDIEALLESSPFTVTVAENGLTFPRIDCSTFVNIPPVCDANGPYTAECSLITTLDGTGSSDPNGDALTYLWDGPFTGAPTIGSTPSVVFPTPTGLKTVSLTVNDGLESSQCNAQVTVQDTTAPSITAPTNVIEECSAPEGTSVALGTPAASDTCDPTPFVTNNAPDLFTLGDTTVTWTAIDDDGNQASGGQMVTIIDTTPPEILCNAVDITPVDAPISFTASASDQCQGPLTAEITDYDCFVYTKKGKLVKKTKSCVVSFSGDQITILDSGGVSDMIEWTVTATDDSGNSTTQSCSLNVIKPGN